MISSARPKRSKNRSRNSKKLRQSNKSSKKKKRNCDRWRTISESAWSKNLNVRKTKSKLLSNGYAKRLGNNKPMKNQKRHQPPPSKPNK